MRKQLLFLFAIFFAIYGWSQGPTLNEGFEGVGFPPDGWLNINVSDPGSPWEKSSNYSHTGTACAFAGQSNYNSVNYLITPKLIVNNIDDSISFWAKMEHISETYNQTYLKVYVSTTGNNAFDFTDDVLLDISPSYIGDDQITNIWQRWAISLEDYIGEDIYIAFRQSDNNGWGLCLDDVQGPEIRLPVCARPRNLTFSGTTTTSIDIGFDPGNDGDNGWYIYYKSLGSTDWDSVYTIDNPHTLTDLSPSTGYELMMRTDCRNELSEPTGIYTFRTECGTITHLPWTDNFDSYDALLARPYCWRFPVINYDFPRIINDNSNTAPASLKFRSSVGLNTYAITPPFAEDINSLRVKFYLGTENIPSSGTIEVGVMSDNMNISTFELVEIIEPINTYFNQYEVEFGSTTLSGPDNYIAFKHNSNSGLYGYYLDDIEVSYIPSCAKPKSLAVSNTTETQAEISWSPGNEGDDAWYLYYRMSGNEYWDSVYITDNPYTLTGLSPSLGYEVMIRTDCGDELSEESRIINVHTECAPIAELPWVDNFDTYSVDIGTRPGCWSFPVINNNFPSIIAEASDVNSPPASMKFQSEVGEYTYAITPQFTDDINDLRVRFQLKAERTIYSGTIEVGVMSDNEDTSTFELVETIRPINGVFNLYDVGFGATALSGPNNYIVFRHNTNNSNWFYWLDDVEVSYLPDCAKPTNLTVSSPLETEVELAWNPGRPSDNAWWIYYRIAGSFFWDSVYTNNNPHTLDNIIGYTSYEVMVKTDCGSEQSEESMITSFHTECLPITELPWMEDFNSYGTGLTVFPECWIKNTTHIDYPYISQVSFAGPDAGALSFFAGAVGSYNIAVLPKFDESIDISELKLDFLYRNHSATDVLKIGVMDDPNDETTWEEVAIVSGPSSSAWDTVEVLLASYEGSANYIAFRVDYSTTFTYIDNLIVSYIPYCVRPSNIAVSNINETEAEISWDPGKPTDNAWCIYYREQDDNAWDSVLTPNNPHLLTGLNPRSGYEVMVRTDCVTELSDESAILSFRSGCAPVSNLPWTEGFDVYGTTEGSRPDCWSFPVIYSDFPSIINVAAHVNSPPASLKFASQIRTYTYAITPPFTDDINDLRVKFYLKSENLTRSGTIEVGVMSDSTDLSSFELVEVINPDNTNFNEYEVGFGGTRLSGPNNYIAFRHNTNSVIYYYWLDDVEVDYLPDCARPNNITFSNIKETEADISWNPGRQNDNAWYFYYRELGAQDWDSVFTNDNPFTLSNLDANTIYEVTIRTDCDNGFSELATIREFNTFCEPILDLPWTEGFDTYATALGTRPDCWAFPVIYDNSPSIQDRSANPNSTSTNLEFRSEVGAYTYAITPRFAEDINNLWIKFRLKAGNIIHSGSMEIGVMSDNNDTNTFELVETIIPANNNFIEYELGFRETILSGPNNHIAFRHNSNNESHSYWLDDIIVSLYPTCFRPTDLDAINITNNSADLTWNPALADDGAWYVYLREEGETEWDSVYTIDNPYTLTGLSNDTEYEFAIATACNEEVSEHSIPSSFKTFCDPIDGITDLPWEEGFEGLIAETTLPHCWSATRFGHRTNTQITPFYSYNRIARTGTSAAYFIWKADDSFTTPAFYLYEGEEYEFTFWYITDGIIGWQKLEATLNNPDRTTLAIGNPISSPINTSYEEYYGIFQAVEDGFYTIDISAIGSNPVAFLTFDDIRLQIAPDCLKPYDLEVDSVNATTVEISWTPRDENDDLWWIYYKRIDDDDWDSVQTTDNPYTLQGMSGSSVYEFCLRTDCGGVLSQASNTTRFTTPCIPIDAQVNFPWKESFECLTLSNTIPPCWSATGLGTTTATQVYHAPYSRTGMSSAAFTSGADDSFTTPEFYLYEDEDYEFSFWYLAEYSLWQTLKAVLNLPDGTTQVLGDIVQNPFNTSFEEYSAVFQVMDEGVYSIDIACLGTSGAYRLYFDDLMLRHLPDCIKPTGVMGVSTSSTTAEIEWTPAKDTDSAWRVNYRILGSEDWDYVYTTNNPHTLTGLIPSAKYEIAVRTDCGGEVSDLSLSSSFNMICYDGPITDFPWEEGFEAGIFCWEQEYSVGTVDWTQTGIYAEPRTGEGCACFRGAPYTVSISMLISPQLDMSSMASPYVSFWHAQLPWGASQDELKVHYRESDQDDWIEIAHYTGALSDYVFDSIALPNPSATYQIAFEGVSNYSKGIYIDDLRVYDANPDGCVPPTGLSATASISNAVISWIPSGEELDWEVRLGPDGTPVTVSNPTHTITELDESTNYTVYVRSNCGAGYSNWISISFTTATIYIAPEITASASPAHDNALFTGEYILGNEPINSKGFEYKKASETDWTEVEVSSGDNPFTHTAIDLLSETDYETRAYVITDTIGITYSDVVEFTTLAIIPPEVIVEITLVHTGTETADFLGIITQKTEEIIAGGFEYKEGCEDWSEAEDIQVAGTATTITATTSTLITGRDYTVRAYALTASGKTYSNELDFEMGFLIPPIVLAEEVVVNNTNKTATFYGRAYENSYPINTKGFEYKKDEDDWSLAVNLIVLDSVTNDIIATTPVLVNEQRYTVRAYAETIKGITYSDELDFEITSSLSNIDINNLDITLYPNPATNTTTIIIKGIDGKATISIIDVQGRIITSVDKNSSENKIKHSFNLDGLAKGMYYIRIETSNSIKTQKLIVQ